MRRERAVLLMIRSRRKGEKFELDAGLGKFFFLQKFCVFMLGEIAPSLQTPSHFHDSLRALRRYAPRRAAIPRALHVQGWVYELERGKIQIHEKAPLPSKNPFQLIRILFEISGATVMAAQRFPMLHAPVRRVIDAHVLDKLPGPAFDEHGHGEPSRACVGFDAHAIARTVRRKLQIIREHKASDVRHFIKEMAAGKILRRVCGKCG